MYSDLINFIRTKFGTEDFIPLHAPAFGGNEKKYVIESIDSTYVSSVGKFVNNLEKQICDYTGSKYAIATVNGTAALHMALILADVQMNDLVLTQSLSFVATSNVIFYLKAEPIFIDIDKETLGLSPTALEEYLIEFSYQKNGECFHLLSNRRIRACVPMHTFGHPVEINKISEVCEKFNIVLVEDAAESIGSFYKNVHTGNVGKLGTFSFNGNKTITCGGGGMIITNDKKLGQLGKHLTTQAKLPHRWDFIHDQIGYNYRLPNLNAAMACAQLEQIEYFIEKKRALAKAYSEFFENSPIQFFNEPKGARSNYWLNAIIVQDLSTRDELLMRLNDANIMSRPCWNLMHNLNMFKICFKDHQKNSEWVAQRLINIPSSSISPTDR